MITIYHNNRCGKSREALKILEEKGVHFEVRNYLQAPLNREELKILQKKLQLPAEAMLRKKEAAFKDALQGQALTDDVCIEAMVRYPILMERAIVATENAAVIARPPDRLLEIIE